MVTAACIKRGSACRVGSGAGYNEGYDGSGCRLIEFLRLECVKGKVPHCCDLAWFRASNRLEAGHAAVPAVRRAPAENRGFF